MIINPRQLSISGSESATLSLRLERDNPCNTTIVDQDRNTFYTVATDFANPNKPVTRVHDGIRKLVAEWIWRDARSDLLTISGRPQTAASAWLKKSIMPFREYVSSSYDTPLHLRTELYICRSEVTFQDDAGVKYVWKNNSPGLALQVLSPISDVFCFQAADPCALPNVALRPTIQDAARGPFYPLVQGLRGRSRESTRGALDAAVRRNRGAHSRFCCDLIPPARAPPP